MIDFGVLLFKFYLITMNKGSISLLKFRGFIFQEHPIL